jgi:hypothetical protein
MPTIATPAADYGIFQVPSYDLNEIFQTGHGRLSLKVKGFWSSEPVCIKLRREHRGWYVDVDHSTGGTEGTGDPLDAEMHFGSAIIFATNLARTLRLTLNSMDAARAETEA